MFKLRTIVIFLTSLGLALLIGTRVYGQSPSGTIALDKGVSAEPAAQVSADTLVYDKLASGPEAWEFIYKDAVAKAKTIIETPTRSTFRLEEYYENPRAWGG
jgi:hypothetical protein